MFTAHSYIVANNQIITFIEAGNLFLQKVLCQSLHQSSQKTFPHSCFKQPPHFNNCNQTISTLLSPTTVVPKPLAFLTQILWMLFSLIRYVEPIRFVQRSLLVWVHVDVALDTLLTCVGPAVTTHPLAFTQRTFEFSKASLLSLIWCKTFAFWSGLKKKLRIRYLLMRKPAI